jgi:glycosyltransferase involved in cell wall biosynthesis
VQVKRVALLFLGDPKLDRRIQSFAHMFRAIGFKPTIYFSIPGKTSTDAGEGHVALSSKYSSGPRLFLGHHSALRTRLSEISQADVIMACDLYSLRAASQAKARSGKPILIYDARELYTGLPSVAARPFVKYVWKKAEHDGMIHADFISITAPHDADAIFRVHSFLPRPLLIRNIPLRSSPANPDREFLRRLGIKNTDKVVIYVGGLQTDRGLEPSIAAMKQLPAEVKLLLLGGGSLEGALQEQVRSSSLSNRVIFGGPIEQERVMPFLAACDAGLSLIKTDSPSYQLALPSKVFEYLHAGLPVVSTELKHVIELFDHQPYMHYVSALNESEIATAITRAIESKSTFSEVIAQAASQYSFEADFEKLKLLLEERLAERR